MYGVTGSVQQPCGPSRKSSCHPAVPVLMPPQSCGGMMLIWPLIMLRTLSAARSIAAYRFSSSLTARTAPLRSV